MCNAVLQQNTGCLDDHSTWTTDELTDEIARIAVHIHAATYRLLILVAEFDIRQSWGVGFRSCADYLVWRIGLSPMAAREKVRVARALVALPQVGQALRNGEISYSKVRAITRVATSGTEADLLQIAKSGTTAQLEKLVRTYRKVQVCSDDQLSERKRRNRFVQAYVDDDGMVVVKGRLDAEAGAALLKALDNACAALPTESAENTGDGPAQQRADALGLVAQSALDHQMQRGSAADRTQVVLHLDAAALAQREAGAIAQSNDCTPQCCQQAEAHLDPGLPVSAETARRLCCDASVVTIVEDESGNPLNVGRKTRSIPSALRRALQSRDCTCRFPGCTHERYLEAHHIVHWADGGETNLDNNINLCTFHHRLLHEGGYHITQDARKMPLFHYPSGKPIAAVPEPLPEPASAETLFAQHEAMDLDLNSNTIALWNGDSLDYDWAIRILTQNGHQTGTP